MSPHISYFLLSRFDALFVSVGLPISSKPPVLSKPVQRMTPREAVLSPQQRILVAQAQGLPLINYTPIWFNSQRSDAERRRILNFSVGNRTIVSIMWDTV